jgi:hypothetical protein
MSGRTVSASAAAVELFIFEVDETAEPLDPGKLDDALAELLLALPPLASRGGREGLGPGPGPKASTARCDEPLATPAPNTAAARGPALAAASDDDVPDAD